MINSDEFQKLCNSFKINEILGKIY
jgi:hypothetical protein